MRVLGLITARGGSKGIPNKNIAPLAGRPLLAYTCEAALSSRSLDRVVLSTDDERIARVGSECGAEVPFLRPAELSQDDTSSVDVAAHAVNWLASEENWVADVLVLLQPTSPLRRAHHIDQAIVILERTMADTVVSVIEVPHQFNPYCLMRSEGEWLSEYLEEPTAFDRFRRQEVPRLFARNGPVVLATRVPALLAQKSFYGERIAPYVMSEEDSIDIDTLWDLKLAELILSDQNEHLKNAKPC